jgi:hypothetical protein
MTAPLKSDTWPDLPLDKWEETYELVHLLTQIIGKIKLQFVPFKNHWWNISFLPTVSGFTTGIIPVKGGCIEIDFDFLNHQLNFKRNDGRVEAIPLRQEAISKYYEEIHEILRKLDIETSIWPVPVEIERRTPFLKDHCYREYEREYVEKFHQIIVRTAGIMETFRAGFTGKASPVHFFWGAFDMAVTLFSGRQAPEHQGAPNVGKSVMVKAYNAELASFGFWPGMGLGEPAFYAYTYPEPSGYKDYKMNVKGAGYHGVLREFILPYASVITRKDPAKEVVSFFVDAYQATKKFGNWDTNLCIY